MQSPVYLDYAATTPVDPRVAEKMLSCLTLDGNFGNPASRSHRFGWKAEESVEIARRQVADLLGADPREIVWTSGATESNNLALKGLAEQYADRGRHIITSSIEHKAVLDPCAHLQQLGFDITYLQPRADGSIEPAAVAEAIREDTILVSVMHANNEIGSVNDIAAIGDICRARGVFFHVDAAQTVGKLPIDLSLLKVDLLSLSAHKIYGPKGVGALYVRRNPRVILQAQIQGGGHERGMRSGTLATHQIVGLGEACRLAGDEMVADSKHIRALREQLWRGIADLPGVVINGAGGQHLPGILNVCFGGIDGELLIMSLKDLAVSSGSACTSASLEPSYVLRALGLSDDMAHSSLRLSLGRFSSAEEVERAVAALRTAVSALGGQHPGAVGAGGAAPGAH